MVVPVHHPSSEALCDVSEQRWFLQCEVVSLSPIGSYDRYTRIDEMLSELEIIKLKGFMKHLALKLYASAKLSGNKYIKRLGDSLLINRRVPNS